MAEVRVLIADDDSSMVDLMVRRLSKMGLQADRAEDGRRALELVERTPYDLILTDIYMPGASGLDILAKAKEKDPHVQVVVVTGSATLDNAVEALNKGAFSYLTKPFEHVSVFDNAVSRALEFRRLIRDNQRLAGIQRRRGDLLEAEVTDRIRQMRRKQQDMVDLLARLPQGVLVVDADGRTVLSNPLAEDFLAREAQLADQPLRSLLASLTEKEELASEEIHLPGLALRLTCQSLPPVEGKGRALVVMEETAPEAGRVIPELAPVLAKLRPAIDWLLKQPRQSREAEVLRMMATQVAGLERLAGLGAVPGPHAPELAAAVSLPPEPEAEIIPQPGAALPMSEAALESALEHIANVALGAPSPVAAREPVCRNVKAPVRDEVPERPPVPEKPAPVEPPVAAAEAVSAPEPEPAKPVRPPRKGLTSRLDFFRQAAAGKRGEAKPAPSRPVAETAPEPAAQVPPAVPKVEKRHRVPSDLEALVKAAEGAPSASRAQADEMRGEDRRPATWPPPLPSQSDEG
ncbi:MAG: response regulator [Chloroflexota bacterium]